MKIGPFACCDGSLSIVENADIQEWENSASELLSIHRSIPWWIGDMLVFGTAQYGDDIWQILPPDISLSMIERFENVARKIPPEDRIGSLSWTHHVISLRIPNRVVARAALRHAAREQMPTDEFTKYVNNIARENNG